MLTKKQYHLLRFIDDRIKKQGYPPSYEEMKDAMELRSKSGIHRLIEALELRGFVKRIRYRARAIEVLKMPNAAMTKPASDSLPDNVIAGKFPGADHRHPDKSSEPVSLPLYGRIAAGTPIEALRDYSNTVEVPPSLVADGDHYALEIAGDSMTDAGIFDGDTAIIRRCDTAESGTIIVALVNDTEVTLKRMRKRSQAIALEPANNAYETRIFRPDQVKVQGRLTALIRQY